jgi:hypothetical protein
VLVLGLRLLPVLAAMFTLSMLLTLWNSAYATLSLPC